MIIPRSGKNGFLLISGLDIPIYSWLFNKTMNRIEYRTAQTRNYLKRLEGFNTEQIVLRGTNFNSPFGSAFTYYDSDLSNSSSSSLSSIGSDVVFDFYIGWNDFLVGVRRAINAKALVLEDRIDINYFSSAEPTNIWTTTLVGVINEKQILTYDLLPQLDAPLCALKKCDMIITTSDLSLHTGRVNHVKRASIIKTITRSPYRTSDTNNHYGATFGLPDKIVELEVQGDFDYWINEAFDPPGDISRDYKFYYGSNFATDFWPAYNMKILGADNFIVNIQTGELIQATVHLGVSIND